MALKYDRVPWGSLEGTWSTSPGVPTPSLVADASRSARRPHPRQSSSLVIVIVIVIVVVVVFVAEFVVVVIWSSLRMMEPPLILVTGQWRPRGGARHPSTAKRPGSPCRFQLPCTWAGRRVAVPILQCMQTLINQSITESNPTTTSISAQSAHALPPHPVPVASRSVDEMRGDLRAA